jgi:hypothetical protein
VFVNGIPGQGSILNIRVATASGQTPSVGRARHGRGRQALGQSRFTGNSPSSVSAGAGGGGGGGAAIGAVFLGRAGASCALGGLGVGGRAVVSSGGNSCDASKLRSRRSALAALANRASETWGNRLSPKRASCCVPAARRRLARSASWTKEERL